MVHRCACCGKKFEVTHTGWGYAYGGRYTCTYNCMRQLEKEDEGRMTQEQKDQVSRLLEEGVTAADIANRLGIKTQAVYDFKSRILKKAEQKGGKPEQKQEKPAPVMPEKKAEAPRPAEKKQEPVKRPEPDGTLIGLICDMMELIKRAYGLEG